MALPGTDVVIQVRDTATGGAFTEIDGINNFSIGDEADMLDSSRFGQASGSPSRYFRERIKGIEDGSISLSGDYLPADTNGQGRLRTNKASGLELDVQILFDGTNGFQFQCKCASSNISAAIDGKLETSFELPFVGAPTAVP